MREYEDPVERFGSKADLDQEEIDKLRQGILTLKVRLDELERENRILKQQNYDLTIRYSRNPANRAHPMPLIFETQNNDSGSQHKQTMTEDFGLVNTDISSTDFCDSTENIIENFSSQDFQGEKNVQPDIGLVTNDFLVDAPNESSEMENPIISVEDQDSIPNLSSSKRSNSNYSASELSEDKSEKHSAAFNGDFSTRTNSIREHRSNPDNGRKRNRAQNFVVEGELIGHKGAVYSLQYSNHKEWIASGSFDKTVRIWDTMECKQIALLEGHKMSVSAISWSDAESPPNLVSGGFDGKILEWDLSTMQMSNEKRKTGLIQTIIHDKQNSNIIYSSGSSGLIDVDDSRSKSFACCLGNSLSPVSTLAQLNENEILSSNLNGFVHLWDKRYPGSQSPDESPNRQNINNIERVLLKLDYAISNICLTFHERTGVAFLAVNSYDDTLRIYDRVSNVIDSSIDGSVGGFRQSDSFISEFNGINGSLTQFNSAQNGYNYGYNSNLRLIKEFKNVKTCNWPIRSSFFSETATKALLGGNSIVSKQTLGYDSSSRSTIQDGSLRSGLMIVTGSADPYGIVNWVNLNDFSENTFATSPNGSVVIEGDNDHNARSNIHKTRSEVAVDEAPKPQTHSQTTSDVSNYGIDSNQKKGLSRHSTINRKSTNMLANMGSSNENPNEIDHLVWPQKLEGHSDRVYTTATHNWKLQMCTASADSTILLWKPSRHFDSLISNYEILNPSTSA
ncbi:Protein will die slowly [Smittium mucronatum]|uniref:Protein will die slowly n=1 Tax=Smittium mucronatum TaxID=133383 RepID=A0A1R0GXC1_9FUNG|nr:Protein will die slowly [Smittium mucronatum]